MNLDTSFNKEVLGRHLLDAVNAGDMTAASALLEKGAPVDARDHEGNTPLLLAAKKESVLMAGLLLGHGAAVDAKNNDGKTPLWQAAADAETRELLLEFDADPMLVKDNDYREIFLAPSVVKLGLEGALRNMLDDGMSANLQNTRRESLLMHAAAGGHEGVVALLLERGAFVNHKGENSRTALRFAMKHGHAGVVKLLLAADADTGGDSAFPDENERLTDLDFAEFCTEEIAVAVQEASVKFDLHTAAKKGDAEKLKKLLAQGVRVDVYDRYGMTALMQASASMQPETLKLLLEAKADPNLQRRDENFPIPVQAGAGQGPATIGFSAQMGYSLHTSVLNGDLESVRALVRFGARTDLKDQTGHDALENAEGWTQVRMNNASEKETRAEILKVIRKRRAEELNELAKSATRLTAPTQGLKRPTFGKKVAAP